MKEMISGFTRALFKEKITGWLASDDLHTKLGLITNKGYNIEFGFPGGSHGDLDCYRYEVNKKSLYMFFSFFENSTENDFLTLIAEHNNINFQGVQGATVQFNANRSFSNNKHITLRHWGDITVKTKIKRKVLFDGVIIVSS